MGKYSNRLIYCFEKALQEILGDNGCQALKGLASVFDFWSDLPPLDDLREVETNYISILCQASLDMYGRRDAKPILESVGKETCAEVIQHFYPLNIVSLNLESLLLAHLEPLFDAFEKQPTVEVMDEKLVCRVEICPNCDPPSQRHPVTDRNDTSGICGFLAGYIQAAMENIAPGKQIAVEETACRIFGHPYCVFEITWIPQ